MDSSSVEEPLVQPGYTTTRGRYARGDRVCNKYVGSQYYRVLSTRCSANVPAVNASVNLEIVVIIAFVHLRLA